MLAFAGFGVLIGSAAGSRVDDTLAASAQRPLRIVLPPPSAATSGGEAPSAAGTPPRGRSRTDAGSERAGGTGQSGTVEQHAGGDAEGHAESGRRRR